ncbi:MAG TPA: DUF2867 domain-containing protein [Acidimicrobiales bacterium]|jgi:hypothetical protein
MDVRLSHSPTWSRGASEALERLSTLTEPDYVDTFSTTLPNAPTMSPAEVVHAAFEHSPRWLRAVTPIAQRVVLGLSIERISSPTHPLGWTVSGEGDGWLRLEASSPLLRAQIAGRIEDRSVSISTFIHYEGLLGRVLWPPVSLVHRRVGLRLLRSAAQLLP